MSVISPFEIQYVHDWLTIDIRNTRYPPLPSVLHCFIAYRTLIDSTPGVLKAWEIFAKDYSLDASEVTQAAHGRRLSDTLKEWCRIDDENTLQVSGYNEMIDTLAGVDCAFYHMHMRRAPG